MKLLDVITPTNCIRPGMTILDVFQECVRCKVPVLPYCDESGKVVGRLALRHILRISSLPDYALESAHLLGDIGVHPDFGHSHFKRLMEHPAEEYILTNNVEVSPKSSVQKILALMENSGRNHAFVVEDGKYRGVLTRVAVTDLILNCEEC
jgi:CBS domain-containing protein